MKDFKKKRLAIKIRDALYNVHPKSGASREYGRGIVIGLVAGLMANDVMFHDCLRIFALALNLTATDLTAEHVMDSMPDGYREPFKQALEEEKK